MSYMSRREFLIAGGIGLLGLATGCGSKPSTTKFGVYNFTVTEKYTRNTVGGEQTGYLFTGSVSGKSSNGEIIDPVDVKFEAPYDEVFIKGASVKLEISDAALSKAQEGETLLIDGTQVRILDSVDIPTTNYPKEGVNQPNRTMPDGKKYKPDGTPVSDATPTRTVARADVPSASERLEVYHPTEPERRLAFGERTTGEHYTESRKRLAGL